MIRNTGVRPQMVPGIITGTTAYIISTLIAAGIIPKIIFFNADTNDVINYGY